MRRPAWYIKAMEAYKSLGIQPRVVMAKPHDTGDYQGVPQGQPQRKHQPMHLPVGEEVLDRSSPEPDEKVVKDPFKQTPEY